MEEIKAWAQRLLEECHHGNCPICMDSMSPCPVVELANRPCMDIGLEDWTRWLKHEEHWRHWIMPSDDSM